MFERSLMCKSISHSFPFIKLNKQYCYEITKNSQNNIDKPNQQCYLMNIRC